MDEIFVISDHENVQPVKSHKNKSSTIFKCLDCNSQGTISEMYSVSCEEVEEDEINLLYD